MIRSVLHWTRSFVVLAPFILACSGSQPKDSETPSNDGSGENDAKPADDTGDSQPPPAKPSSGDTGNSGESGGLNDTQKEQMEIVLKRGHKKAENCSASVPEGKGGEGEVKVLFDGQKGRITDVTVGAPWAGTPMESCLKRAWIGEIVLPFDGDPLEVPYPVKIPERVGQTVDAKGKPVPGKK